MRKTERNHPPLPRGLGVACLCAVSAAPVAEEGALVGATVRVTAGAVVGRTVCTTPGLGAAVAGAGALAAAGGALAGPHAASREAPQAIRNVRRVEWRSRVRREKIEDPSAA